MLQKIKTNNFFALKKKEVDLHPRVTTLVGKSACGKSSLIRSLRWLSRNQPTGDRFIHWGKTYASVELEIDGHEILRKRGKSENIYSLDGQEFRSFKNDVPEEVSQLLQLTDLNFQRQHELHFWFSLTAGEVAKQLNQIVNLEIIDLASSRIASKLRETKATLSVVEERVNDFRQQKRSLRWVKDADLELKAIEKLNSRMEIKYAQQCELELAVENIECIQRGLKNNKKAYQTGTKVVTISEKTLKTQSKIESLNETVSTIKNLQKVLSKKIPNLKNVTQLYENHFNCKNRKEQLNTLIGHIEEWEEITCQRKNENEAAQKELKKIMRGNCPICQKPIK